MANVRKGPPPPPAPPPPKSKARANAYVRYIQAHKALKPFADRIKYWASQYNLDPIYFAALIFFESGGNPKVVSSANAIGLGQIHAPSHVGEYVPWLGRRLTKADLYNPDINLHWSAEYFRKQKDKHGGYDAAYRQGYNPGYAGPGPFKGLGVPAPSGTAPQESVTRSVEVGAAKAQNPYLQGQAFADQWHNRIDPIWEAYTGKRASRGQAIAVIKAGWSDYHLELQLSKSKKFLGSPVWQSKAPGYKEVYKSIYGENAKVPNEFVRYGIIHNLDAGGFQELIRKSKNYTKSNEFKTNAASLENIYRTIYGAPDQTGTVTINRAVLNGWSPDQFAKYLRSQPEYSKSQEWGDQVSGLLDTLGGITGQGVVMHPGSPAPAPGKPAGGPKKDNRVKGKAGVGIKGPQYEVGLSG